MASNTTEELDPEAKQEMARQIQDLELQKQRMESLVAQRRQERADMEKEVARMERMKKHLEVMHQENIDVAEVEQKAEQASRPFSGKGFRLGAETAVNTSCTTKAREIIPPPPPVNVDTSQPVTNIQVS